MTDDTPTRSDNRPMAATSNTESLGPLSPDEFDLVRQYRANQAARGAADYRPCSRDEYDVQIATLVREHLEQMQGCIGALWAVDREAATEDELSAMFRLVLDANRRALDRFCGLEALRWDAAGRPSSGLPAGTVRSVQ